MCVDDLWCGKVQMVGNLENWGGESYLWHSLLEDMQIFR